MQESIFTKILTRKVDTPIIYEDKMTFAILDHNPVTKGHALVITKEQIDQLEDCSEELYAAVYKTVRSVSMRLRSQLKPLRIAVVVHGLEIPHAHVHVVPLYSGHELQLTDRPEGKRIDPNTINTLAKKLQFHAVS